MNELALDHLPECGRLFCSSVIEGVSLRFTSLTASIGLGTLSDLISAVPHPTYSLPQYRRLLGRL